MQQGQIHHAVQQGEHVSPHRLNRALRMGFAGLLCFVLVATGLPLAPLTMGVAPAERTDADGTAANFTYMLTAVSLPLIGAHSAAAAERSTSNKKAKSTTKTSSKKRQSSARKSTAKRSSAKRAAAAVAAVSSLPNIGRYAYIAVDADSGQVLSQQNATAQRYPASLTKMMTLYLTFEALNAGRLRLNQRLPVSDFAASQAQTNLHMRGGDSITVEQAIKALVIRSANDASVVLAEAIAGTQNQFAGMMTAKARQLGMQNTVFRNANGLPVTGQYSTARDLALLGIALRKHFPQYYPYFNLREFSHGGRSYTTHNRVLNRFSGADGIKTGYIRMSGFNLVSSAKRNGRTVVAVVMGGTTAQARDNEMVDLLGQSFDQLAGRIPISSGGLARVLPNAANSAPIQLAAADIPADVVEPQGDTSDESEDNPQRAERMGEISGNSSKISAPAANATSANAGVSGADNARAVASLNAPPAENTRSNDDVGNIWGIQVGAFSNKAQANNAARDAQKLAARELRDARIAVTGSKTVHRARLTHIDRTQAEAACRKLSNAGKDCFVLQFSEDGSTTL